MINSLSWSLPSILNPRFRPPLSGISSFIGTMDRVGNLPDEILCHILSFLPTKDAALTSTLAKRWVNLWKLVPNLDIDDSLFLHPEDGKGEREEIRQSFVDFVDKVLAMQGDSPIQKFSLKSITCVHPDCVNRWIRNVIQRGVSDLVLFFDFNYDDIVDGYYLPEEMFVSKTLVNLKLRSERCVDWWHDDQGGSLLPMLKTLDIESEMIFYGDMETFLPSFPVLEEIRMANMEWRDPDVKMSSSSLRTLKIHGTGVEGFENPKSISFDTPNLLFLSYTDLVAEDYPLVNMQKLTSARINFILKNDQIERVRAPKNDLLEGGEDDILLRFGNVVKLLKGIQNVQTLSLLDDTLEVLSLFRETMPVFNKLKLLAIKSEESRGWQAVPIVISKCPHLESMIIDGLVHHVTDMCGDACPCIPREDKGRSLKSCRIKLLEVRKFRGTMKEMGIIKHFLDYFPCLKEMQLHVDEDSPTQLRNPVVCDLVLEMFELYSQSSGCHVHLMSSDNLHQKWLAHGFI